jgi:hypothetical protein
MNGSGHSSSAFINTKSQRTGGITLALTAEGPEQVEAAMNIKKDHYFYK